MRGMKTVTWPRYPNGVISTRRRSGVTMLHPGVTSYHCAVPILLSGIRCRKDRSQYVACEGRARAATKIWRSKKLAMSEVRSVAEAVAREVWPEGDLVATVHGLLRWGGGMVPKDTLNGLEVAGWIGSNAMRGGWALGEPGERVRTARGIRHYRRWSKLSSVLRRELGDA